MKIQFDSSLEYQDRAISSVVNLFKGQKSKQSYFTIAPVVGKLLDKGFGVSNQLDLTEEDIKSNLQRIQLLNGIEQSKELKQGEYNFTVEMETGTGKTYVYLKTILELNKNYGFTKFIIVVPSVAIREGVYKSLEITKEHFNNLYNNTIYDFFIYNSSNLEKIRDFALNENIQIMIINIDAFKKSFENLDENGNLSTKDKKILENKANIIHRENEGRNGINGKPIDYIRETNPIVIIDEPQSVATTEKSKEAIEGLNPLCTISYSATPIDKTNQVYKLDAIDAYELGIVKQIEVASFSSLNQHNHAYMLLKSVSNKNGKITAKLELDVNEKGSIKRKTITIKQGDDLYEKSKNREVYNGYIVNDISCVKDEEYVDFTSNSTVLRLGKQVGGVDDLVIKEPQIRKTIEEHLNKELKLNRKGIKVLSLFFIDRVSNYRVYDENGNQQNGIYAQLFEKNYKDLITRPKYKSLLQTSDIEGELDVSKVHNGYFSVDKKSRFKDKASIDDDVYNLIMKDKETLLSLDNQLRFIFSHSALREGWDNPNVFQICTLNESTSEVKKRQEIGRGLRLCVNQDGQRQYGFDINTLTVMANESYEEFVDKLQKEYIEDEKIEFGVIKSHTFANITISKNNNDAEYLGQEKSESIFSLFKQQGYIDEMGKVQDSLKIAIKENKLIVPENLEKYRNLIISICRKISGNINIKSIDNKRTISVNKQVYLSEDFKNLWNKIKYKTKFDVNYSTDKLIEIASKSLKENLQIKSSKLIYSKNKVDIDASGVKATEIANTTVLTTKFNENLPDIITYLQNQTSLTRKTIVTILIESKTLDKFKINPQSYMEESSKIITSIMKKLIVDGIKYTKLGDSQYYAQELFNTEELIGYFEKNMVESKKSVYDYVVYDSDVEKGFAQKFEKNENVKVYAKLPSWFKIPTPLGSYNPDWAVLVEDGCENKLYFVVETKANIEIDSLRPTEYDKIRCGQKHFEALGYGARFTIADSFRKFLEDTGI